MKESWFVKSRVTGFVRFYGRRVWQGWARAVRLMRRALWTHRRRTLTQRVWFGLAATGVVTWAILAFSFYPRFSAPSPSPPQTNFAQSAGDIGQPAAQSTDNTPVEAPQSSLVAVEAPAPPPPTPLQPVAQDQSDSAFVAQAEPPLAMSPTHPVVIPQVPALPAVSVEAMVWPVDGEVLQPFGWHRHPVFNDWRYSAAVGLRPLSGDDDVRAALAGRVKDVVNEGGLWRVSVEHAGGWLTEYEGLREVRVESLSIVDTGQSLGVAGHGVNGGLLFTLRQGETAVDPSSLLGEPALAALAR